MATPSPPLHTRRTSGRRELHFSRDDEAPADPGRRPPPPGGGGCPRAEGRPAPRARRGRAKTANGPTRLDPARSDLSISDPPVGPSSRRSFGPRDRGPERRVSPSRDPSERSSFGMTTASGLADFSAAM